MNKIEVDLELAKFDGTTSVTVYKGGMSRLKEADLKWREEETGCIEGDNKVLKLSEIAEQVKGDLITVVIEGPLRGEILQYGNYGPEWWQIGTLTGYA